MLPEKKVSDVNEQNKLHKCPICDSNAFDFLFEAHDYLIFFPFSFNLMKCRRCGLVGINPVPDKQYIYYGADNYKQVSNKVDIFFKLLNPNRVRIVEKFKKSGRVLDIGCGNGEFLFNMEKQGWEVFGNEPSPDLCALIKNRSALMNIYNGDLLSGDLPDKFFDVVTLWHVLEHLNQPLETLKKINRILKDDGILIIESPNFESYQRRFFKGKWYALGIPRHIHHFSPRRLEMVLNLTGLKIVKKDYFVNHRVDFIGLKRSLLRRLHLELIPDAQGRNESIILVGLKRYKIIYKLLRITFEMACLVLSLFLSLINCGNTFRIYCRKSL